MCNRLHFMCSRLFTTKLKLYSILLAALMSVSTRAQVRKGAVSLFVSSGKILSKALVTWN